jgi:hypothetical protein
MATLSISQELADKLNAIAHRQNRPLEAFLNDIVEQFETPIPHLEDDPRYQAAQRRVRPKLYARARRYWQQVGDQARLALTDEQLDEQFWCIDPDGIPRLKVDQATVILPPDPFEESADRLWHMAHQAGHAHLIGTQDVDTRHILNTEFADYLLRRMNGQDDEKSPDR